MEQSIASRTALRVALRRAAHQIHDSPVVFNDPLAVAILGGTYAEELRRTPLRADRPFSIGLRAFLEYALTLHWDLHADCITAALCSP